MNTGNFHVYKSSAGSGKTYTLVKEYLKIVLPQPDKMRQILAITFTNAAAAEMKSRIIEELGSLAALPQNPVDTKTRELLNQILKEYRDEGFTQPAEDRLIENAGHILTDILHNYSDFSVSTIDSFVHRIVRTFAFDLRIPVNFEIELDNESLLNKAVDMLVSRAGSDEKLTELLIRFILNQVDEEKDLRIEKAIGNLAKTLMDEDSTPFIEKLKDLSLDDFLSIQQYIISKIRAFEQNAKSKATKVMQLIELHNLKAEHFYRGKQGIYSYFENLSQGLIAEKIRPNSYVLTTLEEDKWYGGKAGEGEKAAIDSIKYDLQQYYLEIHGLTGNYLDTYQLLKAVSLNLFPLGVLNEVQRVLEEIKTENVLLHISDFNRKISAIVTGQPVPFIYERIGERYQHYMIDEFQDTSVLQWQNLLPLVENGLASGNLSLVVGDGKQAIYRWRNGDVEQFVKLPQLPDGIQGINKEPWQQSLIRNYEGKNLGTNYRSRKVIVDFNNHFFEQAKTHLSEPMQAIYAQVQQEPRKGATGGYVQVSFLENSKGQEYIDETLLKVKETIEQLLEAGHAYRDITILCRSNNKGSQVARFLLRNQVPVISSESLLLNQSEEVIFFIANLKLLVNRHDAVAAVEWLGYLLSNHWLETHGTLHQALKAAGLFPVPTGNRTINWQEVAETLLLKNNITFRFSELNYLNLYDICENITRTFFTRGEPNPFVSFFLSAVFEYSEKNSLSIADFLQWWEEFGSKYSLVVPKGLNAVQVMTIHKAKGLQFPVVIFPFAELEARKSTREGTWVSPSHPELKDLPAVWLKMSGKALENTPYEALYEDEMERTQLDVLNMAYVAFTRPKDKLFIISKQPPDNIKKRPSVPQMLKAFLSGKDYFSGQEHTFSFGEFEKVSSLSGELHEEQYFRRLLSRSWTAALRMRSNQEERGVASAGQRERGKLLHRAMEQIITSDDIQPVLSRMRAEGEIDQFTEREWNTRIRELISLGPLAPCFASGAKVKAEAGLFDETGNFYRPDRVVMFEDRTVVIDYKTGKEYASHGQQIENYGSLLEKMGYPAVEKMLLYLDEYRLKTV
ncbi:MAG: UvrD-helicase domain-containing protein [Bacteroides sp.]|jgi:ATP-dependent exoDNAse (exonuclease V) beta subunit|nr:UvrD-helicase domain-containing protein [Bacteroides sp.]